MIPLEDNFNDILGKAQRGLKLTDAQLAAKSGVSETDIARVKGGAFDEAIVRKLAAPLGLGAERLVASGKKAWYPKSQDVPGLVCFNTQWEDMTVNYYLAWDAKTREAVVFDTGANCDGALKLARDQKLAIKLILLTHTHPDHIADLAKLKQVTNAPAFVSELEPVEGAQTFPEGKSFSVGGLKIESRRTTGHSKGGTTFVVSGLPQRIAIVGDAMFAGSMGGGGVSFDDAITNNRKKILTLPDDTILCCGHGPLTTVGEEKQHNPFYPEFE